MTTAKWLAGLAWALSMIVMTGCGSADSARGKAGSAESTSDTSTTDTAHGEPGPVFHRLSLDQALSKAKTGNKLVMIDFYADWCPPCKKLDQFTWKDSNVQNWLREKTIAIKIDVDKDEDLAAKYGASSIPLLVFLKPDGSEVGRLKGYHSAEAFLQKAGDLPAAK